MSVAYPFLCQLAKVELPRTRANKGKEKDQGCQEPRSFML